jgi:hypothetical protein
VLFACTGITKAVSVRVTVDVAEATLAVDVKVVMPTVSPVFSSPVAVSITSVTGVVGETVMLAPYPLIPDPVVRIMAPVPEVAQPPEPDVVLEKVWLHVKVLSLYA